MSTGHGQVEASPTKPPSLGSTRPFSILPGATDASYIGLGAVLVLVHHESSLSPPDNDGAPGVFPVGRLTIGAGATQNINNPSPRLNKNNQVLCV